MNKIYLLVEINRCSGCNPDWILNQDIGIASIYGYRLNEKEADLWVLERCRYEYCGQEGSILRFEKDIYINNRLFKDDAGNLRKRAKAKGYYKERGETNNFPVFAYIEVYDNVEASPVG
jgi:hypothetical protein